MTLQSCIPNKKNNKSVLVLFFLTSMAEKLWQVLCGLWHDIRADSPIRPISFEKEDGVDSDQC